MLQHFERGNAVKIHNRIMFNFHPELGGTVFVMLCSFLQDLKPSNIVVKEDCSLKVCDRIFSVHCCTALFFLNL